MHTDEHFSPSWEIQSVQYVPSVIRGRMGVCVCVCHHDLRTPGDCSRTEGGGKVEMSFNRGRVGGVSEIQAALFTV